MVNFKRCYMGFIDSIRNKNRAKEKKTEGLQESLG
jgi:hypothetical protein